VVENAYLTSVGTEAIELEKTKNEKRKQEKKDVENQVSTST
jgi:hypothetical protein